MLRDLKCELCEDWLKKPKMIKDCGHSFCGECIDEYFDLKDRKENKKRYGYRFRCPQCGCDLGNSPYTILRDDYKMREIIACILK